jgi:predicted small secreted protein
VFKKISAVILCLVLILNVLMLSSCTTIGRPGDISQNGDAASDSSGPSSTQQFPSYFESPVIDAFEALPEEITAGMTSTLTWNVMNATSVDISPDIGSVNMSGSIAISPVTTTDYTLTACNEYDTVTATISVSVLTKSISPGLPVIHSFLANPQDINEGDNSSLSWSISDAESFMISPNVFRQLDPIVITENTPVNVTVSPSVTTSYTLTAINEIGSVDQTITITVYPQTANLNWSGTWDTNWGTMYLTQSLGKVTGTYDYDDGKIEGYISKNLSGNILVGTWSEYPSYAPPDDAGDIEFIMSSDSNSFTGRWRYGYSGDWYSDWNGTRVSP